ncbi:citrate synthase family protein [Pseudoxanthomonas taiwanensis]|uniref:citrate synthase (unknown stereospecificity) n=1 Tax=Pseudoxanthomonas taiwanensis J19 TaxID=935569 RepID=A0A562DYP1_9GAMM|nr:citrate synthase family protein [Pseudoxanthomonas taiwanensis]TWH14839.1 citrate synthase [Pseudoxanthomonas taiwanensis J19]
MSLDRDLIPATEACRLLGISPATLYAYVSRGLLESRPGRDHRSRVYRRQDVERLAQRKRLGRGPARGAAQSLDRGLPVLETRISLIRPDGPYYRGRSAVAMARAGATLEDTARLLWDCGSQDPFADPPGDWPARVVALATDPELPPLARAMAVIPLLALQVPHSFQADQATRRALAATLLRQNAGLLVARRPSGPVHRLLAGTWCPGDEGFAELVRAALVLCADHELNVSAFAARVVASTGAHLHATVCAGLSALAGPRHGGATARVYALLEDARQTRDVKRLIAARWRQGEDLPGFGHALYPDGDPRATELLAMLRTQPVAEAPMQLVEEVVAAAEGVSERRPNVDFMLAAICYVYGLPAAPALSIFAAGRLAGWLAHVLEQQALGRLIRPRASYTGLPPESGEDSAPRA